MTKSKATPMIKQYLSIKDKYKDAILFYRMGDFYEMFFEDAEVASRVLEITLTSRNKNNSIPVPMCGFPYRAAQGYISRLIDNGYKVAICDQVEDPATAKGLVKRDVIRVVTPGMIFENELLDARKNNFLLSVFRDNGRTGLSYIDISTGTFKIAETEDIQRIFDEVLRIDPSEILFSETAKEDEKLKPLFDLLTDKAVSFLENRTFEYSRSRERLLEQFKTLSLEGFGCEAFNAGTRAAGSLLSYIQETQKQQIKHISKIETYPLDQYLLVDDLSSRNLELVKNIRTGTRKGTLIGVLDHTTTAMGGRLLNHWVRYPLLDIDEISRRLDAVEEAKNNTPQRDSLIDLLKNVYDLERLGSKITMGHANARDLVALKKSIQAISPICDLLKELKADLFQGDLHRENLIELADLIENSIREDAPPTINEGGIIKTGFNAELDELIQISRDGKGFLAKLEVDEKSATGIKSLKVKYNKVFGYYIEVPKAQASSVPPDYVRKQTLVNAERYITDELKSFELKILGAEDKRTRLESRIFNDIREMVIENNTDIQDAAAFLARLDCLLSLGEVSEQNDYNRPKINEDGRINLDDGRHPVVEKLISGERFVPNTINLDNDENQVLVITGPNMAGKSTMLRQVALLVVMAQMGSFVPAEKADVSITDRIFTRVGALDNLSQGQSTFMVEMQETANILNNATARSLVIMDEIGRGTSTYDGLSIAWAVAEYLHDKNNTGVKTLFATHYHELTELEEKKARVKNFNIAVKEWNDEIIFLRKLIPGGTNRSYGIQVARLAGIPDDVITRAKKIMFDIENEGRHIKTAVHEILETVARPKVHEQIELFSSPQTLIIDKLKNLEILKMTPLEAMNCLSDLQEKTKGSC
ncbi:MAG: DNA mismatch repair protein MutS [Desulfobacterales bacterium]|nr:DNA mismatch repair protein MutS [Desulfobacterales bacterium]